MNEWEEKKGGGRGLEKSERDRKGVWGNGSGMSESRRGGEGGMGARRAKRKKKSRIKDEASKSSANSKPAANKNHQRIPRFLVSFFPPSLPFFTSLSSLFSNTSKPLSRSLGFVGRERKQQMRVS